MRADIVVATPTLATVRAIENALDAERPLALLHARLPAAELSRQRALVEQVELEPGDALIVFTSGSTGAARGIVHTRASITAAAEASALRLGWLPNDRWLVCLPLAHTGGLSIVVRCRLAGKPIEITDGDIAASLAGCTLASLVPTQLAALLDDRSWRPPATLRAVLLGGAAAPPALVEAALARGVPVHQTYGLTETFGQLATARVPGGPLVPLAGVELSGSPLRVRGPMLARCYLDGAPIAPELVTADLGEVREGVLRVLGRADDVIITGGENVHPAEVEAVLAATPGVRTACVFGLADERWGQVIGAAVAGDIDRDAAAARWHAALPPHARPRRLAVVAQLPQLPNGKLDRRAISALPTDPVVYR
jgi:O-succinylbenzoic acid--CoA ligase